MGGGVKAPFSKFFGESGGGLGGSGGLYKSLIEVIRCFYDFYLTKRVRMILTLSLLAPEGIFS